MKKSEMNQHQTIAFKLMDNITCEYIGGNENTMEDYSEEDEAYINAKNFLEMGHDKLVDFFYQIMIAESKNETRNSAIRFAGTDFIKTIIEKRLIKWGY